MPELNEYHKKEMEKKIRLVTIIGTRPEIIRLAAVINKTREYFDVVLAHTGQNYDYNLNGIFFRDLELSDPEVYMDAVGDDLGGQFNFLSCHLLLLTYSINLLMI